MSGKKTTENQPKPEGTEKKENPKPNSTAPRGGCCCGRGGCK